MTWKSCMRPGILLGVGVAIVLAYLFLPRAANWSWILLVLICPLSMLFMMSGKKKEDGCCGHDAGSKDEKKHDRHHC